MRSGLLPTRRGFLAGTAATVLGLAGARGAEPPKLAPLTSIPEKLKGSGEVRIAGYGGTGQAAERAAWFQPFEQLSGIRTRDFEGVDGNKIKAMVESRNVEWDVVQISQGTIKALNKKGDYFEKLDYDLIDTADIDPVFRTEYGQDILTYGEVMAYRTDAFGGKVPKGWADFWDTKAFPGARTMASGNGSNSPELEFALMAMGVPPDKIYPIDVKKAYDKLAQIKPAVEKWWDTGAQPVQMLSDKEVVLATVWNGRVPAIQAAGAPVEISWDQGLLKRDCYAIPKGARNRENAMKFIAFMTMPIPQARLSTLIPYGGVNNKAAEYVPAEALSKLPTAPGIKSKLVPYDYNWWAANRDSVIDQWNHWVLD